MHTLFSLIRLSSFDPDILYHHRTSLLQSLPSSIHLTPTLKEDIHSDLLHIRDHVLFHNPARDVCFELGRLHLGLGEYDVAGDLFQDSVDYVGDHPRTWYNKGVCFAFEGEFRKAMDSFKRVGWCCNDCVKNCICSDHSYDDIGLCVVIGNASFDDGSATLDSGDYEGREGAWRYFAVCSTGNDGSTSAKCTW